MSAYLRALSVTYAAALILGGERGVAARRGRHGLDCFCSRVGS